MRRLVSLILFVVVAAAAWAVLRQTQAGMSFLTEGAARLGDVKSVLWPEPPGAQAEPDPGVRAAPRRVAGQPLSFELSEAPARQYGATPWSEADRAYAEMLEPVERVEYDPALGHAARELAQLYAVEDGLVPGGALEFLLHSGGAADWSVRQSFTATTSEGPAAIRSRVEALLRSEPDDGRPVRVGVGEVWRVGASPPRTIAILVSRSDFWIDPLPRQVAPGSSVTLSGALPRGARAPALVVMGPDLVMRDVPATATAAGGFAGTVDLGSARGVVWVELLATTATGPTPLAQLPFYVGVPIPSSWSGAYPPDETRITDEAAAERVAFELLDADRARQGLPALEREPALDAVARAHSRDMRDNGFFGHVSPTTGDVGDRLKTSGYRFIAVGENVARNGSLNGAEEGLMRSLGHRRNILGDRYTRAGIGVAAVDEDGRRVWLLTQVFARPVPVVDAERARAEVLGRLEAQRAEAGLPPLSRDPALEAVATEHARKRTATVQMVLEAAKKRGLTRRGAYAWLHRVGDLDQLDVPPEALGSGYRRVGLGVYQDHDRDGPTVTVVAVLGG